MKYFKFRCARCIFEEKKAVRLINGDEIHTQETTVTVYFEQVEEPAPGPLYGFGYINLTLSVEQFKEMGYRVGREYVLAGILSFDSVEVNK